LLWAGDWRIVCFRNWDSYDGEVQLITVTAPGVDLLPWDEAQCTHPAGENCSGKKGCQVQEDRLAFWNLRARGNWSKMHRNVGRWTRYRCKRLELLGYVWQFQDRGALHVHLVVGVKTPANRHAAALYGQRLKEVSLEYGFGFVDTKFSSARGQRVAAYLTRYLIAGSGDSAKVQESVTHRHAPSRQVYVASRLTTRTHCTMRSLRRQRYMHVIRKQLEAGDLVVDLDTGELLPARPTRYVLQT
jgi:hypothetical protein